MSAPILIVENVGKAYLEFGNEFRRFARWFGADIAPDAEHWVLRHVSFRVERGEAIGIIGQNGAGKSTLLKLIAGTTQPTEGAVRITGKVSALLELGLGFNAELTGRENAVHAAGLMGFSQAQIADLMPSVEDFAEIGDYFDQPMRTYSSGMQMRVAFSIATAARPDVLIVDEALAVGDAYFVHKCFQRIQQFRDAGTTLLFVSHDPGAIQALCDRAVLIDQGRMLLDGPPKDVFDFYNGLIAEKENSTVRTTQDAAGRTSTESGTGEAILAELALLDQARQPVEYITVGQPVVLHARARVVAPIDCLVFGYMIRDRLGQPVFGTNTHHTDQALAHVAAGSDVEFDIHFPMNIGPGTYSMSVALSGGDTHLVRNYQWKDLALVFTVANADKPVFVGSAYVPPEILVRVADSTGA